MPACLLMAMRTMPLAEGEVSLFNMINPYAETRVYLKPYTFIDEEVPAVMMAFCILGRSNRAELRKRRAEYRWLGWNSGPEPSSV